MKYKFRAEVRQDVAILERLIPYEEFLSINIGWDTESLSDIVVVFDLKTWSLNQLIEVMDEVVDGHVMIETVALEEDYTGERRVRQGEVV